MAKLKLSIYPGQWLYYSSFVLFLLLLMLGCTSARKSAKQSHRQELVCRQAMPRIIPEAQPRSLPAERNTAQATDTVPELKRQAKRETGTKESGQPAPIKAPGSHSEREYANPPAPEQSGSSEPGLPLRPWKLAWTIPIGVIGIMLIMAATSLYVAQIIIGLFLGSIILFCMDKNGKFSKYSIANLVYIAFPPILLIMALLYIAGLYPELKTADRITAYRNAVKSLITAFILIGLTAFTLLILGVLLGSLDILSGALIIGVMGVYLLLWALWLLHKLKQYRREHEQKIREERSPNSSF